jgi:hypothetical protein
MWLNRNKREPKHPDYTGQVQIAGHIIKLSMWQQDGAGSRPDITIRVNEQTTAPETLAWIEHHKLSPGDVVKVAPQWPTEVSKVPVYQSDGDPDDAPDKDDDIPF